MSCFQKLETLQTNTLSCVLTLVKQEYHAFCLTITQAHLKACMKKKLSKNKDRWVVSWSNIYDSTIETANEAVRVALADLDDTLRNVSEGANVFIVEDISTGSVSVITSDLALSEPQQINNIINVDQSVTYAPSVTINLKEGKKK